MRIASSSLSALVLSALCAGLLFPTEAQQVNPGTQSGLPPFGTFHGSNFDQVNLVNGNLHIEIPIVSVKQRGGGTLAWKYVFDSPEFVNQWYPEPTQQNPNYGIHQVAQSGEAPYTPGWRLVGPFDWTVQYTSVDTTCPGTQQPYTYTYLYNVVDPEGTKHPLPLRTEIGASCSGQTLVGPTLDGTGILVNLQTNIITLKDGTQVRLNTSPASIRDTNGNLVTRQATDTLNRNLLTTTNGSGYTLYTVMDSSGQQQIYRVDYESIALQTDMCNSAWIGHTYPCYEIQPGSTMTVPQKLTLPNGKTYLFSYANPGMGELTRIDLPTGGFITYTYVDSYFTQPLPPRQFSFTLYGRRGVGTRTVDVGGNAFTWTYTLYPGTPTIIDPYGNKEVRTVQNIVVTSGQTYTSASPVETKAQFYDPSGNLLRTITKDYTAEPSPFDSTAVNVRMIRETITLENNLVSKKETDYETFQYSCNASLCPGTATRLNPTETREYDYGSGSPGALLRRTDYTYLHTNNSTYINLNIVNRPLSVITYDGSSNIKAQTQMEYDNYTQAIQASGAVQHDSSFSTSYLTRGNVTATKKWRNTDGAYLTTRNQYDDAGNILSTADPGGHTNTFDYADSWTTATGGSACAPSGGQGRAYLTHTTDALGHQTFSSFFSCTGFAASVTDVNSQTTSISYDLFGRTTSVQFPSGGGQSSFTYDDTALIVTASRSHTSSTFVYSREHYDQLGRVTQDELCEDGTSTCAQSIKTDHAYDGLDRVASVSNPYRSTSDPTYGLTSDVYDGLSRPTKVIPPDGTASANNVSTTYAGNCMTVTDQAAKIRKSCADALGRLTQVSEPDASNNLVNETDYQYDTLNNLIRVDQKGNTTDSTQWRTRTFTYNSLKQLLTANNPETGTISYTYDNDGQVLTRTAPKPNQTGTATVTTTYSYDPVHRLTGKTYSNGDPSVTYTYDQSGCLGQSSCYNIGRSTGMTDAAGSESWSYDDMGRVLTDQRTTNNVTKSASYVYAPYLDGSLNSTTYPSGQIITYAYDSAGRPTSAADTPNNITYASNAGYGPSGALASLQNGGSLYSTYLYNTRLQPCWLYVTTVSTGAPTGCTQSGVANAGILDYQYDFALGTSDNGDLMSITNRRDNTRSQSFTYDSLNRVSTAQTQTSGVTIPNPNCWGLTFGYDVWGNLLTTSATGPAGCSEPVPLNVTVSTSNIVLTNNVAGVVTNHCYDAVQNLIQTVTAPATCPTSGPYQYTYNAENQLASTASVTYIYDGKGRRVQKSSGKLYWYGMGSDALDETDLTGVTTNSGFKEYIFFGGKRIASRDYLNNVDYYFADHLGSARVVTNAGGTILDDSDFYPFGGERPITSSSGNNYKFTGKERDPESGLDDFGARYYSSALGRWLTPDWSPAPAPVPFADLSNPQTLNLYAYVNNNPITGIDPDGHMGATNSIVPFMKPPASDNNYSQELTFSLQQDETNDPNDPNAQVEAQNNGGEAETPAPGAQNSPASNQPPQAQNQSGLTVSVVSGQKDAAGAPYAEAAAGFSVSIQSKTNFAPGDLTVTADLHFDADKKVAKGTEVLLGAAAESAQAKVGGQEAPKTVNSLLVDVRPYNKSGSFGGKPQEGGYIRFTTTDSQGHKQTGTLNVQVISKRIPGGYSLPAGAWVQRLVVPIPNP
jgi:RHS repeat-associated protein